MEVKSSSSLSSTSTISTLRTGKAALPHHIAPLKGMPDVKHKLKSLGPLGDIGQAPWDKTGKPLGALGLSRK